MQLLLALLLSNLTLSVALCHGASRRRVVTSFIAGVASLPMTVVSSSAADLSFQEAKNGIQWADAKIGTGPTPTTGSQVAVDYVLSTTGARYGSKIYSTADKGSPYRWTIGDESTIQGLEDAILGGNGIEPMKAGGVRRMILPSNLAYQDLDTNCRGKGPAPPLDTAFDAFQRFKNIYCNPNRPYQPNVVLDVKLYGKRTVDQ